MRYLIINLWDILDSDNSSFHPEVGSLESRSSNEDPIYLEIIEKINQLINKYHFQLVCCSSQNYEEQTNKIIQLKNACERAQLPLPSIHAITFASPECQQTSENPSCIDTMLFDRPSKQIYFNSAGNTLQAITAALNISNEKNNHLVFEKQHYQYLDISNKFIAYKIIDGYPTYYVQDPTDLNERLGSILRLLEPAEPVEYYSSSSADAARTQQELPSIPSTPVASPVDIPVEIPVAPPLATPLDIPTAHTPKVEEPIELRGKQIKTRLCQVIDRYIKTIDDAKQFTGGCQAAKGFFASLNPKKPGPEGRKRAEELKVFIEFQSDEQPLQVLKVILDLYNNQGGKWRNDSLKTLITQEIILLRNEFCPSSSARITKKMPPMQEQALPQLNHLLRHFNGNKIPQDTSFRKPAVSAKKGL